MHLTCLKGSGNLGALLDGKAGGPGGRHRVPKGRPVLTRAISPQHPGHGTLGSVTFRVSHAQYTCMCVLIQMTQMIHSTHTHAQCSCTHTCTHSAHTWYSRAHTILMYTVPKNTEYSSHTHRTHVCTVLMHTLSTDAHTVLMHIQYPHTHSTHVHTQYLCAHSTHAHT